MHPGFSPIRRVPGTSSWRFCCRSSSCPGCPRPGKTGSRKKKSIPRQKLAVALLQVLSLTVVATAPFTDCRQLAVIGTGSGVRYLGLALFGLGFLLVHRAESALGSQFTTDVAVSSGHRLIVDGPYKYLRHPRYLGIILFTVGISLVFSSWAALAAAGALTGVLAWRISDEEKLLQEKFGTLWDSYCRRTWRMVPFLF